MNTRTRVISIVPNPPVTGYKTKETLSNQLPFPSEMITMTERIHKTQQSEQKLEKQTAESHSKVT